MNFALTDGISFCISSKRTILLDLPRDRYVSLAPGADRSFQRLAAGGKLSSKDRQALDQLVRRGLLTRSPARQSLRACAGSLPERTIFEAPGAANRRSVARALWNLSRVGLGLRFKSLDSTLASLRKNKLSCAFKENGSEEQLQDISAAFASCSLVASALDQCLPRSIALARMMIGRSISPDLVIGVRLQPFSAHCWVQHQGILVNDTLDRVRTYSPILIV